MIIKLATFAIIAIMTIAILSGCAPREIRHVVDTVEVKVPVLEKSAPAPKELYRGALRADEIPVAIEPNDPAAVIAFDAENQKKLQKIIHRDESLLDGWEKYGETP